MVRCNFGTASVVLFMAHGTGDTDELRKLIAQRSQLFFGAPLSTSREIEQMIQWVQNGKLCGYAGKLAPNASNLALIVAIDAEAESAENRAWQTCGWRLVVRSLGIAPARNIDDPNAQMLWMTLFRFLYSDLVSSGMNADELRKAADAWIEREKKKPQVSITFH